jgi:hypothetical protein
MPKTRRAERGTAELTGITVAQARAPVELGSGELNIVLNIGWLGYHKIGDLWS